MSPWLQQLPVMPVLLPLCAGAAMLMFPQRRVRAAIALFAGFIQLAVAVTLLYFTSDFAPDIWPEGVGVYALGGWPAPYGIVLVVDRLAAFMLLLSATLTLPIVAYSLTGWDRAGVHYYPLLQFLLMGLSGVFLTGDIFNLFVFFEVTLAASYGLMLHGPGSARVKAGLHYIVVNLVASLLFLVGAAIIYGVCGTLNMADLAARVASQAAEDQSLFHAGVAILGIAFLIKAGSWPLNFWLPAAYSSASVPVAAVFSILTKVGVYAILRIGSLLAAVEAGSLLEGKSLLYCGLATMLFAIVGMLAAQQLRRIIAFSVIASSGTVLAALGLNAASLTAPALFYLLTSVLGTGAFFMLTGMADRTRVTGVSVQSEAHALPAYAGLGNVEDSGDPLESEEEVGVAIPAATAFLGAMFVCCTLLVAGLPPLSGFLAKFALLVATLDVHSVLPLPVQSWLMVGLLLTTGLASLIAFVRIGMRLFWSPAGRTIPRLRVIEAAPVAWLVTLCIALTIYAAPVMTYLEKTAGALHSPQAYIHAVLSTRADGIPLQETKR